MIHSLVGSKLRWLDPSLYHHKHQNFNSKPSKVNLSYQRVAWLPRFPAIQKVMGSSHTPTTLIMFFFTQDTLKRMLPFELFCAAPSLLFWHFWLQTEILEIFLEVLMRQNWVSAQGEDKDKIFRSYIFNSLPR